MKIYVIIKDNVSLFFRVYKYIKLNFFYCIVMNSRFIFVLFIIIEDETIFCIKTVVLYKK